MGCIVSHASPRSPSLSSPPSQKRLNKVSAVNNLQACQKKLTVPKSQPQQEGSKSGKSASQRRWLHIRYTPHQHETSDFANGRLGRLAGAISPRYSTQMADSHLIPGPAVGGRAASQFLFSQPEILSSRIEFQRRPKTLGNRGWTACSPAGHLTTNLTLGWLFGSVWT